LGNAFKLYKNTVYKEIPMTTAIKPIEIYRNTDGVPVCWNRVQHRDAIGGVPVLHPIPADRGAALMQALEAFDDDFADLLVADQKATLPLQGAAPANPKCSSA